MRLWLLVSVVVTVGCVDLLEPRIEPTVPGARPMAVIPDSFVVYWKQIDDCSGQPRPMTSAFFLVDSVGFGTLGLTVGLYQTNADRITLSLMGYADPMIVRHEMLHAHGFPNHEPAFRSGPCAALVYPGATEGHH